MNCLVVKVGLLCSFFVPLAVSTAYSAPPKSTPSIALLVGIGAYGGSPGVVGRRQWSRLRGPKNDVRRLAILLGKRGFRVSTLLDEAATKAGIAKAFNRIFLKALPVRSDPENGPVVLFHFSGHGQQITDDNGDEPDGYDESLVPFDNRGQADSTRNIRDDTLERWLTQLQRRTTNIVFSLDSCHSGTAVRGLQAPAYRGTTVRWQAPAARKPGAKMRGGERRDGPSGFLTRGPSRKPGYVLLSAVNASQLAQEYQDPDTGEDVGLFSYFLVKVLSSAQASLTYGQLINRLRVAISRHTKSQTPQLEGDRDKLVFSGTWKSADRAFSASFDAAKGVLKVQAGTLHALSEGGRLVLVSDRRSPDQVSLTATISRLALTSSTAEPSAKSAVAWRRQCAKGCRVRQVGIRLRDAALAICAGASLPVKVTRTLKKAFGASNVSLGSHHGCSISILRCGERACADRENDPAVLAILDAGGGTVPIPVGSRRPMVDRIKVADSQTPRLLVQAIRVWHARHHLQMLGDQSLPRGLDVKLLLRSETATSAGQVLRVRVGSRVAFSVENRSRSAVYISLFELSSDGSISLIAPRAGIPPEAISAGKRWTIGTFRMGDPIGTQQYLLVGTSTAVSFAMLQHGVRGGSGSELSRWLGAKMASRGVEVSQAEVAVDNWGSDWVSVIVQPKSTGLKTSTLPRSPDTGLNDRGHKTKSGGRQVPRPRSKLRRTGSAEAPK